MNGRFQILTSEELTKIHDASLKILKEIGVSFRDPEALEIFRNHGVKVDGEIVYLDEMTIHRTLEEVPASFDLVGRDPAKTVTIAGPEPALAPGYGSPFILEPDGRKRPSTLEDYRNFCKLVQTSKHINLNGFLMCEPDDVPAETGHLQMLLANLTLSDKPTLGSAASRQAAIDSYKMACLAWGGAETIGDQAVILAIISALSPLQYSEEMAGALIEYARHGQPVMVGGLMMAGSTGPVTLPGLLTLQNAEYLAGIVLAQLIRPGLPCIYGGTSSITEMRTGGLAMGAPEMSMIQHFQAQIARFYNLPCRGSGSITDSFLTDYQAGAESALGMLSTLRAGSHFILHSCGILGSYLAMSYEKFMADEELCGMVVRMVKEMEVSDDTIDFSTIDEVGIGGEYLTHQQTFRKFRSEFHTQNLMQRGYHHTWEEAGAAPLDRVAVAGYQQRLEEYQQPDLDPSLEKDLVRYTEGK